MKIERTAQRFLRRMHSKDRERMILALKHYESAGEGDVSNLKNRRGLRLRVGSYRAIIEWNDDTLHILDIGNRGEIY